MDKKTVIDLDDRSLDVMQDIWGIEHDQKYTFFYDESNNCRKFWLNDKQNGFNTDYDTDFVLAGLAYGGSRPIISFDELRKKLRLQANVEEIKFNKQFSEKTFLECLKKKRLYTLLQYIDEKELYIHYLNVNNLYYTLVEIFDSITTPDELDEFGFDYLGMKSAFYEAFKGKEQDLQKIMCQFHYPNINKEDVAAFANEIKELFPASYQLSMEQKFFRHCLERAAQKGEMVFLHDNEDYIMQENYLEFYIDAIRSYEKATHYFDEEDSIQKLLEKYEFCREGKTVDCYTFINSKEDIMIQLSDVIAGIIGKLFIYVNRTTALQIRKDVKELDEQQLLCAQMLGKLRKESNAENRGFLHSIAPLAEIRKVDMFFEEVERRGRK